MRKFFLLIGLSTIFINTYAQDPVVADIKAAASREIKKDSLADGKWRKGGLLGVTLNQGSSNNWAAGAEKFSFSVGLTVNAFANKNWGKWQWNNTLDLGYAFQKTTSQGSRKTDDKIDLYSKIGYEIKPKWRFSGVFNFRSQFTNGYDYDYLGKGLERRTSAFMAPAYLTIAPGFEWEPSKNFSILMTPLAMRMVIVTNDPLSYYYPNGNIPGGGNEVPLANLYGVDVDKKIDLQLGAYVSANFIKELSKSITYKSRLDLYSNYLKPTLADINGEKKAKPQNIDIFWTNTIVLKVNKWLAVTYNFDLIYDDNVRQFGSDGKSAATQTRSSLAVGITSKF